MSKPAYTKEDIAGYECRHVVYCDPKDWSIPDMHFVKEIVHLKNGDRIPKTRKIFNYQRPFWIDREATVPEHQRTYKQKKERQKLDRLIEYKCQQRNLVSSIAKSLKQHNDRGSLKQMCRSPYVYGADILSTAVIKKEYQTRFPKCESQYTICALDIESDMTQGTHQILMCTIAMKEKVYTVIDRNYFRGYIDVETVWKEKLNQKMDQYLGDIVEKRKMQWEVTFVDTPAQVVLETFKKLHIWQPDILAIWNMDFDIPKMVAELEAAGLSPAQVFSDPDIPPAYRFYRYKQGSAQKVTASGKVTPVPPEDRWHTAFFPASFYVIDAMCAYRGIRNQKQRAGSYSLDAILNTEIERGKLKFAEADHVKGGDWHTFMQSEYPFEYVVYNVFDVVGMLELDEKTMDLSAALPKSSYHSDFQYFRSQPRRLVDRFHYTCLRDGYVIGTTSDQMAHDLDRWVIGMDGWVVALPAFMIAENGMELNLNASGKLWRLVSSIFGQVADLDVSAAYPTNEVVANISQETTFRELGSIDGVTEDVRRTQGINLSGGFTNAVEFCVNMFHTPDFIQLLDAYEGRPVETIATPAVITPPSTLGDEIIANVESAIEETERLYTEIDRDRAAVDALFKAGDDLGIDPEAIASVLEYADPEVEEVVSTVYEDDTCFTTGSTPR
jgi:hypothetical protein